MSVKAITWAFEQDLPPAQKVILLALADWADGDGVAYPGQKSLSHKTSIPERTLRRAIQELEEAGYLVRRRRSLDNGQRTSDEYQLLPAKMAAGTTGQNQGDNRPAVAATGEPSVEPSVKKKRMTSLPPGWEPSNAHRMQALDAKVDVDLEAEKFKDWVASNGLAQADWEARFRNWIRNARPTVSRPGAPVRKTTSQRMEEIMNLPDPREQRGPDLGELTQLR